MLVDRHVELARPLEGLAQGLYGRAALAQGFQGQALSPAGAEVVVGRVPRRPGQPFGFGGQGQPPLGLAGAGAGERGVEEQLPHHPGAAELAGVAQREVGVLEGEEPGDGGVLGTVQQARDGVRVGQEAAGAVELERSDGLEHGLLGRPVAPLLDQKLGQGGQGEGVGLGVAGLAPDLQGLLEAAAHLVVTPQHPQESRPVDQHGAPQARRVEGAEDLQGLRQGGLGRRILPPVVVGQGLDGQELAAQGRVRGGDAPGRQGLGHLHLARRQRRSRRRAQEIGRGVGVQPRVGQPDLEGLGVVPGDVVGGDGQRGKVYRLA